MSAYQNPAHRIFSRAASTAFDCFDGAPVLAAVGIESGLLPIAQRLRVDPIAQLENRIHVLHALKIIAVSGGYARETVLDPDCVGSRSVPPPEGAIEEHEIMAYKVYHLRHYPEQEINGVFERGLPNSNEVHML